MSYNVTGDRLAQKYPPLLQSTKPLVTTGKNCLDLSVKELSTHGIRCIEHLYKGVFSNIFVGYMESTYEYVYYHKHWDSLMITVTVKHWQNTNLFFVTKIDVGF